MGSKTQDPKGQGKKADDNRHDVWDLDAFFELSRDLVCIAGLDGYFKRLGGYWERLTGWTGGELCRRPFVEFVHPEDRDATIGAIEALTRDKPVVGFVNRYCCKDGSYIWVEWNSASQADGTIFAVGRDVTARRSADEILRLSEERFRAVIDHAPALIGLFDNEDRFTMVNRAFPRAFGHTNDEVVGKTLAEVFSADVADRVAAQMALVRKHRKSMSFDIDVTYRDGTRHTHVVNRFPVFGADGAVTGIGSIATDITERRIANEAVRESEKRFRAFIDNAPVMIVLADSENRFVMVNRGFTDAYGIRTEDIVGKTTHEVFGENAAKKIEGQVELVRKKGTSVSFDLEMIYCDGSRHTHVVNRFPIFGSGGTISAIGAVATDITERQKVVQALRESEERIRAIMDHAPLTIILKDLEGRFVTVNDHFLERTGMRREDIVGHFDTDILERRFADTITAMDQEVIRTQKTREFEMQLPRKEGGLDDYHVTKFPVFGPDGNVVGVGTISSDVTEQKKAQEEAKRLHMELARSIHDAARRC